MPYCQAAFSTLVLSRLTACSDRPAENKTAADPHGHDWTGQERALEKARGVGQTAQDAAERARTTDNNPGY